MHIGFWDMLVEVLQVVDHTRLWRAKLAEGFLSLVPQGKGVEAAETTPRLGTFGRVPPFGGSA